MGQLEALLKQLCPDKDFSKQLGPPVVRDSWKEDAQSQQPLWAATSAPVESKVPLSSSFARQTSEDTDHDSSEDLSAILDVLELPNNGEMAQKLELHGEEGDLPHDPTEPGSPRSGVGCRLQSWALYKARYASDVTDIPCL
ncbi:hypothetical protein C0992_006205 [Termitomyces sp. T32_za158]|nr:hypothetical protein C0992_006205 [Termitomyces sp. T32_za158]